MASSSGTLLQYYKQPIKEPVKPPNSVECIVIDEPPQSTALPSSSKRKSVVSNGEALGKRRKLSLSSLRAKQSNIPPVLENEGSPQQEVQLTKVLIAGRSENVAQSVNDILLNPKSKTGKCNLAQGNHQGSNDEELEDKFQDHSNSKEVNSNLVAQMETGLTISNSSIDEPTSPVKVKAKNRKRLTVLSDSDEETQSSESEIKVVNNIQKNPTTDINKRDKDKESDLNSSVGRRSTRVRKPVERFCIDISDHTDDDDVTAKPRSSKKSLKTPNKKRGKENTPPLDDLVVIEDGPPPRKSVSAVLGVRPTGKKKKGADVPRVSSSTLMQEAKKLMQATSSLRSSPVHMACSSPTAGFTSISVPKAVEEIVWPKISHVGQSHEIIIYPLLKQESVCCNEEMPVVIPNTVFRHEISQDTTSKCNKTCDKVYDDCVEEMSANHPHENIESLIEHFRNFRRSNTALCDQLPKEAHQTENRTWAQLYCPQDYKQHIGNRSGVKQLYKWLDGWRVKLLNEKRKKKRYDSYSTDDDDYVDSEGEEVRWLDNVVLLTGPSGVGKSGAIATCAAQLGYKVIELNASSERSGKNVAELFSEAAQSHCVSGKSGAADFTRIIADIAAKNVAKQKVRKSAGGIKNFFGKSKKGADSDKTTDVINVDNPSKSGKKKKKKKSGSLPAEKKKSGSLPVEKNKSGSLPVKSPGSKGKLKFGKRTVSDSRKAVIPDDTGSKVEKLSLIVLEEIDLAFEEDRGFLAAIVALTQVAKRPIILTSNNPNITLPTDSEFLVLNFAPPKVENVMLRMGCLSLSYENYITPYQLQQYIQHHNSDLRKVIANLEFLNISSKQRSLTEIDLTSHLFGVDNSLNSQRILLEQTQALNIQLVYLNLSKLMKNRKQKQSEKVDLLEQMVCSDTFVFLDLLSPKTQSPEFQLYPARTSAALTEHTALYADPSGVLPTRVAVEDQLVNSLKLTSYSTPNTRLNTFKLKERKRFAQIKEVQRGISEAVSGISLMSSCVMDEFSALRQICRTEKTKEQSGAKRRFLHYLDKEVGCKDRELLTEYCLAS